MGVRGAGELKDSRIVTKNAIEDILKYYHVKSAAIPDSVTEPEEQLEYALRPSGIFYRKVKLTGKWYKNAFGPMIVSGSEDGMPTAVFPRAFGGYYYYKSGKKVKINASEANNFSADAVCFYRPLPLKKIGIRDLLIYMKNCLSGGDYAIVIGIALIVMLVGFIMPYLTKSLTGFILESGSAPLLWGTAAFIICASVTSHVITSARDLAVSRIQTKTSLSVESAMMMRLMSLPAPFFRKYSSGELASRAKSVNNLCGLLIGMVFSMGLTSLLSLFYIGQIFEFAPGLTLPAVVIIAVTVAVIIMTTLYQTSITRREMEHSAKESGLTYSIMTGVQKIKLAGAEKRVFAKWAEHYSEGAELIYDPPLFLKINNAVTLGVSLIGTMIIYYLAVITGVSQSEYIAFNTSYGMIMGAFGSLAQVAKVIGEIRPILEMAEPILTEIPETSAHKQFVTRVNGNVELNNVYFRYNENMPYIVDGLDLKIRSGEYIAIVGKTGCGKSTLLRLLLGFETPEKGAIYYDGNDTTKIDLRSLRRKIGVVTQNDDLFQGDIFSNIAIVSPSLTLEETWEAAELAGIADDIRDMPMGMQTVIGEGQGGISGGQKQRIMIARAIASKPKILMFDEATSALDNKTQKIVSEALDGLKCTRIVIAHRLSTIKNCDRILVLDNGKIVEDGTYDELIARNGCFEELVERQRIGDDTNKCCKFGEKP